MTDSAYFGPIQIWLVEPDCAGVTISISFLRRPPSVMDLLKPCLQITPHQTLISVTIVTFSIAAGCTMK